MSARPAEFPGCATTRARAIRAPPPETAIRRYQEIDEAFFEEEGLIPDGRFQEIGHEDLGRDPIGPMRGVYESLRLPEFAVAKPAMRRYVDSMSGYRKNDFPGLETGLKERASRAWRDDFDAWGYHI
jgi:hypothetical protein